MSPGDARDGRKLGIGLIGLGEVGQHHLRAYERSPRATLVAVADLSANLVAAAAASSGARPYATYQELLRDPGIDAVDVCLPHDLHLAPTLASLHRGHHVLVEKPMGLSVAECDEMIATAAAVGRVLAVSHNQLFYASHQEAVRLLRDGAIGRPLMVRLRLGVGGRYPGWRQDPDQAGGGILFDAGVHRFYMAREFLGDPVSVTAVTDVSDPGPQSEGLGIVALECADGAWALIDANYENPAGSMDDRIEITGDRGLLSLAGCEAAFEHFTAGPPLRLWQNGSWRDVDVEPMDWSDSVQAAVFDFIDAILDARPPRVSGEDGRAVVAMIRAAYDSARTGCRVAVGLQGPLASAGGRHELA
jgi:UDP-N-acetylglucosamine 3-dehydrogenase